MRSRAESPRVVLLCLILAIGLPATGCARHARTRDWTQPTVQSEAEAVQAVLESHDQLVRAYEAHNVEIFTSLLEPSPDLLIFHPMIKSRFDDLGKVERGLTRMFRRLGDAKWTVVDPVVVVHGDVAWLTANIMVDSPMLPVPFVGRGTEIWVRRDGAWRLIHAHWSENPEMHFDEL
ncbi:MAG: YybH family protein [Candidatus Krumholzibacteriia bacterium]